jgi:hypothetical protein
MGVEVSTIRLFARHPILCRKMKISSNIQTAQSARKTPHGLRLNIDFHVTKITNEYPEYQFAMK